GGGPGEQLLPRVFLRMISDRAGGRPRAAPTPDSCRREPRMTDSHTQPLVYFFGQGRADGTAAMKEILGGKGAGLAEMTTLGIPVPPGFTISATVCGTYLEVRQFPPRLRAQVEASLQRLEAASGKQFGGSDNPLLVSVRSGVALSMPG